MCNVRSTPCSLVKPDEEWGELSACEAADNCGSSHTRTEQQFHPEVMPLISSSCIVALAVGFCWHWVAVTHHTK